VENTRSRPTWSRNFARVRIRLVGLLEGQRFAVDPAQGRDGHQWCVLTATDPDAPGSGRATPPESVQRWVLRDRNALKAR